MSPAARRNAADLDLLWRRLGRDLGLTWRGPGGSFEDADLATVRIAGPGGSVLDVGVAERVAQAEQLLVNRLMTRQGELAPLGHPEYGSRHHELIGEPDTPRTRNLIKLYVLQALAREPRVAEVLKCEIVPLDRYRDVVRIDLRVRLIDVDDPLNLVVPFGLAGGAS